MGFTGVEAHRRFIPHPPHRTAPDSHAGAALSKPTDPLAAFDDVIRILTSMLDLTRSSEATRIIAVALTHDGHAKVTVTPIDHVHHLQLKNAIFTRLEEWTCPAVATLAATIQVTAIDVSLTASSNIHTVAT